ncbi:hypothetical protein HK104_004924, partial [Borealophlyctis nickersoniae]
MAKKKPKKVAAKRRGSAKAEEGEAVEGADGVVDLPQPNVEGDEENADPLAPPRQKKCPHLKGAAR